MNIGKIQFNKADSVPTRNSGSTRVSVLSHGDGAYFPCFKGLHVSPKTLEETHFTTQQLLSIPEIKNASDRFEVRCTSGKKKYNYRGFAVPFNELGKSMGRSVIVGVSAGALSTLLPETFISTYIHTNELLMPFFSVGFGIIAGCIHAIADCIRLGYKKAPELNIQIGQNIGVKDNNFENSELLGHKSDNNISLRFAEEAREFRIYPESSVIQNSCHKINIREEEDFKKVLSNFDTDDLFDANNYLKLLQTLKEKCPNDKHILEHTIDKMGNTMLTQFFDVPLTDKNSKTYDEILNILSKEPRLDFNQKGYMGVSILEKIMLSENSKALDFAKKYTMFNYYPELNDIYVNIQDKSFKEKAKNLQFEYKDLTNALLNKSGKAIKKLMPYIERSELLDRLRVQSQVEFVLENRVNDRNFEQYLAQNFPQLFFDTKEGRLWRGGENENK